MARTCRNAARGSGARLAWSPVDEWGARLQFAFSAVTHGLFASTTIGLIVVIAVAQTIGRLRGDERMTALARAWARPYVVVYVLGIAAGMLLEAQFGLNWGGLIDRAGNVVGAPLTVETFSAFVAESTLLALWTFGWDVLHPRIHLLVVWGIVVTAVLSVFWALVANGFLQHPRGYGVVDGALVITDLPALLLTADVWISLAHVVGASLAVGGLLVAGVGASRVRRSPDGGAPVDLAGLRTGAVVASVGTIVAIVAGAGSFWYLSADQPGKFATASGQSAERAELARQLAARYGRGEWLPPSWLIAPAMLMMLLAVAVLAVAVWGTGMLDEQPLERSSAVLVWLPVTVPLPFLAVVCGWVVREVGRQPWVVQGLLRTEDGVTSTSDVRAVATTAVVLTLCVILAMAAVVLVRRVLRSGDAWPSPSDEDPVSTAGSAPIPAPRSDDRPVPRTGS